VNESLPCFSLSLDKRNTYILKELFQEKAARNMMIAAYLRTFFVFLLFCALTTHLEAGWSPLPGITISSTTPGIVSDEPQIGIDALGNATAIWREYDSINDVTNIRFAILPKGVTGWSSPDTISSVAGNNTDAFPQISVTPSGYSIAVWEELNGTSSTIKSSTRSVFGGVWSSPLTISAATTISSQVPQVSIDPNGNAVAVWVRNNGSRAVTQAATLLFNAPFWTNVTDLSDTTKDTFSPQVGLDSLGNGVAVWTQVTDQIIQSRTYSGGIWLPTVTDLSGTLSNVPELAVNPSGIAVAVWTRFNGSSFVTEASRFAGGVWSAAADISTPGSIPGSSSVSGASVAVDLSGNAVAVWSQFDPGNNVIFIESAYLSIASGVWSIPIIASPTNGFAFDPRVAFDSNGNATAVWDFSDPSFTFSVIQAAMLPFGTNSWINLTDLSTAGEISIFPQIAVDPSGYAVVDWQNNTLSDVQAISFVPPPTVTNVNPNFGPTGGGNLVTITGTNFINVIAVNFGTASALSFIVNSPTSITAIVPPGFPGTVDVTVTTLAGTSPVTVNDQYTYQIPPPIPPLPPTDFKGVIKKIIFLNKTECVLKAKWSASPSPNVIFYRIYKNGTVVATVLATSPFVFKKCLHHCCARGYEIAAVSSDNLESIHIKLRYCRHKIFINQIKDPICSGAKKGL
jgi:hypothetical protein